MKKIGLFLFAAVMSLLAVSCRDVLLEKNIGGFSVSFQTPGSSSRAGTTATWELEAWLELEGGAQLQKKNDTVPANAPITISFDAVPIGTKLKVQVRLEDSENQFIQHEGSSDWITVDAESKAVVVQVQRTIINAAAPTITEQPQSWTQAYQAGGEVSRGVTLRVAATSPDGGNLSYQWYENTANSNRGGNLIPEATKENYHVPLNPGETKYFYCEVTNTNDGVNGSPTATTISNVAELVYNIAQSGVLLWNNSSVKIAPYGKYESKTSLLTKESPYPVWCFDNLGNLYWYVEGENAVKRSKLQADGTYSALGDDYPGSSVFLAYDNITDSLYKMTGTEIIKAGESTGINLSEEGISPVAFAVHDNIAYIVGEVGENDDGIPQIVIRNYNLGTSSLLKESSMYQLPTSFGTNPSYQMIYHEGALYLLLRRFEINDASNASVDNPVEHYSLGALAKIDPNTLTLDTSFGNGGYLGLSSSPVTFNDRKDSGKTFNVTYHGSTAGNDTFFGPVGFVAVMPKKLVIGDAGFAMSADGADTVSLTKKSRVVTVDLETLAFDATDIDTSYYQSDDNYSSISSKVSGYSYIVIANN